MTTYIVSILPRPTLVMIATLLAVSPLRGQTFLFGLGAGDKYSCGGEPLPYATMYVYNDGADTLHLSDYGVGFAPYTAGSQQSSTTVYDRLHLAASNQTLLVFCRTYFRSESAHGGTFDIDEASARQDYEIWNLATKQHLLTVEGAFYHDYNRFEIYVQPSHRRGHIVRDYEVAIDADGTVTQVLKAYTHTATPTTFGDDTLPALPTPEVPAIGSKVVYRLANGAYIRQ